jgi:hypothetical protein
MTYSVKTIYPEFKCLTAFRKVMKRIESYTKQQAMLMKICNKWLIENCMETILHWIHTRRYNTCKYNEEYRYNSYLQNNYEKASKEKNEYYQEMIDKYRNYYTEEGMSEDEIIKDEMKKKFPMWYKFEKGKTTFSVSIFKNNWLLNERNKYDMMAKKWEFQQAMISRDYKAVTLCDDVIGLVFEYL